ncbi:GNAT family N-acetyltransferase [Thermococcus sp. 101 C5]|uniref:GNAT family N-acetyltransferase n=1 Tax=Thermococcus sp. 101 C5 TaxID=2654197 RepID=UPI00352E7857
MQACIEIAKGLPEWFIERDLRKEETYLTAENGNVLGSITVKPINEKALEILWMAVKREHRRKILALPS